MNDWLLIQGIWINSIKKERELRERLCVVAVDWVHGSLSSRGCLTNGNGPWRAVCLAEAMAECLPATQASHLFVYGYSLHLSRWWTLRSNNIHARQFHFARKSIQFKIAKAIFIISLHLHRTYYYASYFQ